eukprot:c17391_g1_i2.p1 GENE.c17391_g1_i2~~c17391_g1_i2.p1  ORF type:complete len:348 (-),score=112.47 c17391_g1_i2:106-1149(-)
MSAKPKVKFDLRVKQCKYIPLSADSIQFQWSCGSRLIKSSPFDVLNGILINSPFNEPLTMTCEIDISKPKLSRLALKNTKGKKGSKTIAHCYINLVDYLNLFDNINSNKSINLCNDDGKEVTIELSSIKEELQNSVQENGTLVPVVIVNIKYQIVNEQNGLYTQRFQVQNIESVINNNIESEVNHLKNGNNSFSLGYYNHSNDNDFKIEKQNGLLQIYSSAIESEQNQNFEELENNISTTTKEKVFQENQEIMNENEILKEKINSILLKKQKRAQNDVSVAANLDTLTTELIQFKNMIASSENENFEIKQEICLLRSSIRDMGEKLTRLEVKLTENTVNDEWVLLDE